MFPGNMNKFKKEFCLRFVRPSGGSSGKHKGQLVDCLPFQVKMVLMCFKIIVLHGVLNKSRILCVFFFFFFFGHEIRW